MSQPDSLSGVVLVDKPGGITSFDVVRRVKRLFRVRSAGHTGTLDPMATGLLPVCLGDATRIATFITDGDKEYEGVARFGVTTDTLDAEGTVLETRDASALTEAQVRAAVDALAGVQSQVAPMYSARKVDGKRLYELARAGVEVEREAREITVLESELLDWTPPDARFRVRCSKGTYVRVLAQSLGETLGCGAHLSFLRRTGTGAFHVRDALPLEELEKLAPDALTAQLRTVEQALEELPAIHLDERRAASVGFGNAPDAAALQALGVEPPGTDRPLRLVDPDGLVVAVGEMDARGGVKLLRVLRARVGPGLYRGRQ